MKKIIAGTIAAAVAGLFLCFPASVNAEANSASKAKDIAQKDRIYSLRDFFSVKWLKDPQLSSNGKKILFTKEMRSVDKNAICSSICVLDLADGSVKSFSSDKERAHSARWSPDGRYIAFIKSVGGDSQVYVMPSSGGKPVKITDMAYGASGPVWSPDSKKIIFASSVYAALKTNDDNKAKKSAKEKSKVKARIINEIPYQVFDHWRDDLFSHLFIVDIDGKNLRDLTPGKFDVPPIDLGTNCDYSFSPDGKEICFVSNKDKNLAWSTNNDLFRINLENMSISKITENKGNDAGSVYSPNGRYIAYVSMERPGFEADRRVLTVYDRKTSEIKKISDSLDRSILGYSWSPDGNSLVGWADDDGFTALYKISMDGTYKRLTNKMTCDGAFFSKDGQRIFFRNQNTVTPPYLVSCDLEGNDVKTVLDINPEFSSFKMNKAEHFHFKASDGETIQGFIVRPPNFRKGNTYPLVYLIHGGPQSSWTDDFHQRWNTQLFASDGYVVATVNFRGSTGWGQKFTDAISGNWGGTPYQDLMEGLDYILASYDFVDKDRMAAVGASYGGYMVNWIMGHTDRFACAISLSGVFNTISEYGTTEELWFPEWEMGGTPYENRELYEKWNPVNFVSNFKTPCLVIHGEEDYRVPVSESKQLFTALRRNDVPAQFLYFPDECHFIRKPQNMQLWYKTMDAWLKRWLKG